MFTKIMPVNPGESYSIGGEITGLANGASDSFDVYPHDERAFGVHQIAIPPLATDADEEDITISISVGENYTLISGATLGALRQLFDKRQLDAPIIVPPGSFLRVTATNASGSEADPIAVHFYGFAGRMLNEWTARLHAAYSGRMPQPIFYTLARETVNSGAAEVTNQIKGRSYTTYIRTIALDPTSLGVALWTFYISDHPFITRQKKAQVNAHYNLPAQQLPWANEAHCIQVPRGAPILYAINNVSGSSNELVAGVIEAYRVPEGRG